MYQMIVSDLDETLLRDDGTLSAGNIQAIKQAVAQGVYFVPNSGRSFLSYQDNLRDLGLYNQPQAYEISYNGALILENYQNRVLKSNGLDYAMAQAIFDICTNTDGAVHIYTTDQLFIYHADPNDNRYLAERGVQFTTLNTVDFTMFQSLAIMKIIVALPTMAQRQALGKKVHVVLGNQVTATYSSDRYIEFNRAQVNKGTATLALAQQLQIQPEAIIAVGDNNNDLTMIQAAGLGVCVANGIDSVKQAAQYVTKRDNNQDAMAEIIEKFVLR
ncbi:Cof-type HAD-IIB family hydrolase [Agrilactobacillus fermenti]|uniref:Cof-type HAD-IIB family hydrolase n=1 Tax=Agrilactobacillus fermenti TaxID=2586909 RepID=UPI001E2A953B|nr:Cof-type HAD-IIB family hydrolase [Agrilactobacillus fermenti]MCD2257168.1 HAD family phosphatase [Agrilactobacillus fermenti]